MPQNNSSRPDLSNYLAHFTKGDTPLNNLISILQGKSITAGTIAWSNKPAVCFTECPWSSLLEHAEHYSSYAIGFSKSHVFAAGGGPVYYVRADHWEKQTWDDKIKVFVTPFWPAYRPSKLKADTYLSGKTVDYSHEREWRVPHNFKFELPKIEFIIINNLEDMNLVPSNLIDQIGRDKFLLMDMFKTVERLWPIHDTQ